MTRRAVFGFKYIDGWYRVFAIQHTGNKVVFGRVWRENGKWCGSLPCSRTADVIADSFVDCRNALWLMNGGSK